MKYNYRALSKCKSLSICTSNQACYQQTTRFSSLLNFLNICWKLTCIYLNCKQNWEPFRPSIGIKIVVFITMNVGIKTVALFISLPIVRFCRYKVVIKETGQILKSRSIGGFLVPAFLHDVIHGVWTVRWFGLSVAPLYLFQHLTISHT